jgi:hypothetical protein
MISELGTLNGVKIYVDSLHQSNNMLGGNHGLQDFLIVHPDTAEIIRKEIEEELRKERLSKVKHIENND